MIDRSPQKPTSTPMMPSLQTRLLSSVAAAALGASAGTKVKVLQRRADNWVEVQGDGIPGGSGWVWSDFVG
jgi:hypothetical protein